MEIHSFLLDILKLIIPIATGILSLSIAFIDKIDLDLKILAIRRSMIFLWVSLVFTILFAITTSFFVYTDVDYFKQSQKLSQTVKLNEIQIKKLVTIIEKNGDNAEVILDNFDSIENFPDLKRSWETKTNFFITLIGFGISIMLLIRIGFFIIKKKTSI